jgi:pyruvate/2-oxoglutarate dehydrogenase complex dihydrolipoamide acyltransferase (E2) component
VEGTLTKWLKKAGDHVERDEPLFEISTDKVDTEIPSPAAGTLSAHTQVECYEPRGLAETSSWR